SFEGLSFNNRAAEINPTSSIDVENTEFDYPYEFTCNSCSPANNNWKLANVWLNAPTGQFVGYWLANTSGMGLSITNVTETGATTAGQTFYFVYRPAVLTFTGNVTIGSASVQRGLLNINGAGLPPGSSWVIQNNFDANPEGTVSSASNAFNINFVPNDSTSSLTGNICWGSCQCFHVINPGTTSGPLISWNWGAVYKEAFNGQGIIESPGHYFRFANNILIVESTVASGGMIGTLAYVSPSVFQYDNNTIFFVETAAQDQCVNLGDTSGSGSAIASPSWFRSNLLNGCNTGIVNNVNDTFSTSQCDSAGVCNNLVHATTRDYCVAVNGACSPTSHGSSGWDDGTHYHPNSLYGDLPDSTDPYFVNPTLRPTGYDSYCGGPGTLADLGTQFSYRIGPQLGTYNPCYNVASMLAWLQAGFAPQNLALKTAGFGGTYVGAIPPKKPVWEVPPTPH
ncbi:MAG TPA: hypothetical protein VKV05_04900, partial [Terriglobales bacterium]|nr:hypothetical protein [Terriglobales bacterium]